MDFEERFSSLFHTDIPPPLQMTTYDKSSVSNVFSNNKGKLTF